MNMISVRRTVVVYTSLKGDSQGRKKANRDMNYTIRAGNTIIVSTKASRLVNYKWRSIVSYSPLTQSSLLTPLLIALVTSHDKC